MEGLLAAVVIGVLLLAQTDAVIRGAGPDLEARVTAGELKCGKAADPSVEIVVTMDLMNDDFCDCVDGVDEPGTSACSNGKFFCPEDGLEGSYLNSSSVNDGFCDCCDGADEYKSMARCTNRCAEKKRERINQIHDEIAVINRGLYAKMELDSAGRVGPHMMREKKDALVAAQAANEKNNVEAEKLYSGFRAAKDRLPASDVAPRGPRASTRIKSPSLLMVDDEEDVSELEMMAPICRLTYDKLRTDDSLDFVADFVTKVLSTLGLKKIAARLFPMPPAKRILACETWARLTLKSTQAKTGDIERQMRETEEYLATSSKLNDAYKGFALRTITADIDHFTYEFRPFKEVKQFEYGKLVGVMGYFNRWDGDTQIYDRGDECTSGISRSLTVELICSDRNEILSVIEPQSCVYKLTVGTPAECDSVALRELEDLVVELEGVDP